MIKKLFVLILISFTTLASEAFEDCIVTNNGKLTDINIEDNTIIDVYPLITIMNEKNTLIVHPLKAGSTRFCALKNNKTVVLFEVTVDEFETKITAPEGFEALTIDPPDDDLDFILDEPPMMSKYEGVKG